VSKLYFEGQILDGEGNPTIKVRVVNGLKETEEGWFLVPKEYGIISLKNGTLKLLNGSCTEITGQINVGGLLVESPGPCCNDFFKVRATQDVAISFDGEIFFEERPDLIVKKGTIIEFDDVNNFRVVSEKGSPIFLDGAETIAFIL